MRFVPREAHGKSTHSYEEKNFIYIDFRPQRIEKGCQGYRWGNRVLQMAMSAVSLSLELKKLVTDTNAYS